MSVESVTQAVSNLALEFGDDDAREGAMVRKSSTFFGPSKSNFSLQYQCRKVLRIKKIIN